MVIAPIVEKPQIEYLFALAFLLVGLIVYVPFVYRKKAVPGMSKL